MKHHKQRQTTKMTQQMELITCSTSSCSPHRVMMAGNGRAGTTTNGWKSLRVSPGSLVRENNQGIGDAVVAEDGSPLGVWQIPLRMTRKQKRTSKMSV